MEKSKHIISAIQSYDGLTLYHLPPLRSRIRMDILRRFGLLNLTILGLSSQLITLKPKQLLIFLEELIKLRKIKALYVGVKNERKALSNKKLIEFLTEHDFENERFKLPKESITLLPLFLIGVIGVILILALRSGYQHASILSVMMIVYFMRSMLFKELRDV